MTPEIQQALDRGYAGDFRPPPTTGPRAVTGRNVWYVSCGQLFAACQVQTKGFTEAAAKLGWNVTVQDGKADGSVAAGLIRQAVAARADGVVISGFDCPGIKSALLEARTARVPVVSYASVDCDDPHYASGDPSLLTTVKFRGSGSPVDFRVEWAKARVPYIIARAGTRAKILWVSEQGQLDQRAQGESFESSVAQLCPTCTVYRVPFTFAQVPNPATQQFATAIQSHPDASVLAEGIDAMMSLGLETAIRQSGRTDLLVGGGEGFSSNFDLIRAGTQSFSVAIPYTWVAWGMADTMNRVLAGEPPADRPDEGTGWQYVDATHNLPAPGTDYEPPVDFRKAYLAMWNAPG